MDIGWVLFVMGDFTSRNDRVGDYHTRSLKIRPRRENTAKYPATVFAKFGPSPHMRVISCSLTALAKSHSLDPTIAKRPTIRLVKVDLSVRRWSLCRAPVGILVLNTIKSSNSVWSPFLISDQNVEKIRIVVSKPP